MIWSKATKKPAIAEGDCVTAAVATPSRRRAPSPPASIAARTRRRPSDRRSRQHQAGRSASRDPPDAADAHHGAARNPPQYVSLVPDDAGNRDGHRGRHRHDGNRPRLGHGHSTHDRQHGRQSADRDARQRQQRRSSSGERQRHHAYADRLRRDHARLPGRDRRRAVRACEDASRQRKSKLGARLYRRHDAAIFANPQLDRNVGGERIHRSRRCQRAPPFASSGQTVATNLFGDESPVGKDVRIQGVAFRVLGVLSPKGANMFGNDQDDLVLAPWTTIKYRVSSIGAQVANQSAMAGASSGNNDASTTVSNTASAAVSLHGPESASVSERGRRRNGRHAATGAVRNVDQIMVQAESAAEIPDRDRSDLRICCTSGITSAPMNPTISRSAI